MSNTMLLGSFKDPNIDLCSNGKHKTDLIKSREMQDQINKCMLDHEPKAWILCHTVNTQAQRSRTHRGPAVKYEIIAIPERLSFVVEWFGHDWNKVFPAACCFVKFTFISIPGGCVFPVFPSTLECEHRYCDWDSPGKISSPLLSFRARRRQRKREKGMQGEREGPCKKGKNRNPVGTLWMIHALFLSSFLSF